MIDDRQMLTPDAPVRIGVGMSGGLDSSVVAALLRERGYDVMGLTLHLFKEGSRCCSIDDIDRARRICDRLDIPHATIQLVDYFRDTIIRPFIDEYLRGRTPSPCVLCNQHVKFGALQTRALQLGCTHVATGHYVRMTCENGRYRLHRASDGIKDQSYFLHRLSQEQLARSIFPLDTWTKGEVASYAESRRLPVRTSSKAESQDLCFVPDDGHAAFIEQHVPGVRRTGDIVDLQGTVVGTHVGAYRYTVGQRKGLGVAARSRLYVRQVDPDDNRVEVAPREDLYDRAFTVKDMHWIAGEAPATSFHSQVRVRYRTGAAPCRVDVDSPQALRITLAQPQFAITPGQAAVLYHEDEVLGGGWIGAVGPAG
jgi:tRNA-specific 2-thiouridylase